MSPAAPAPLDTAALPWIPLRAGLSFKPITYFADDSGWQLLLRIEPGTLITRHRHTGHVHAFNLSGSRLIIDSNEVVGPGGYVYEPAGNIDSWQAIGAEPCIVHVEVRGRIEYLDEAGEVTGFSDAPSSRQTYLDWCAASGVAPHPAIAGGAR